MLKKCAWALNAINYKFDNRTVVCAGNWMSMHDQSLSKLPSDIFNSEGFRNLRKSLHGGTFPENHCRMCIDFENRGLPGPRENHNKMHWHDGLLEKFNPETGEVPFENLEYMEFRFSNRCNFTCLHCMPEYSSKWTQLVKHVTLTDEDRQHKILPLQKRISPESWSNEDALAVADDLIKNFPNLKYLDFSGGEPFFQKQFLVFIARMAHHPNAGNMKLTIASNFNTATDYAHLSELFNRFKHTHIRISVDGSRKIYGYFRTGDWDLLVRNIELFRSKNTRTFLQATLTTSAFQMLDFNNAIRDMMALPVDQLHHSIVQYPVYLNVSVLKAHFEDLIQEEMKTARSWLATLPESEKRRSALAIIDSLENYLEKSSYQQKNYESFIYYVERMDQITKRNFDDHYGVKKADLKRNLTAT